MAEAAVVPAIFLMPRWGTEPTTIVHWSLLPEEKSRSCRKEDETTLSLLRIFTVDTVEFVVFVLSLHVGHMVGT